MIYNPEKHHRKSIRLKGYDYSGPGAYFITICASNREFMFGNIARGKMRLNDYGVIARAEWFNTAAVRPYVGLYEPEFVVMPNHVHGIIWIVENIGARRNVGAQRRCAPTDGYSPTHNCVTTNGCNPRRRRGEQTNDDEQPIVGANHVGAQRRCAPTNTTAEQFGKPVTGSKPTIVRAYKSATTKCINQKRNMPGVHVCQRGYYEHVIRNDESLNRIRKYIINNPEQWENDLEYPDNAGINDSWDIYQELS